jgi:hypothetical protein
MRQTPTLRLDTVCTSLSVRRGDFPRLCVRHGARRRVLRWSQRDLGNVACVRCSGGVSQPSDGRRDTGLTHSQSRPVPGLPTPPRPSFHVLVLIQLQKPHYVADPKEHRSTRHFRPSGVFSRRMGSPQLLMGHCTTPRRFALPSVQRRLPIKLE